MTSNISPKPSLEDMTTAYQICKSIFGSSDMSAAKELVEKTFNANNVKVNSGIPNFDSIADHVWETLTDSPLSQDPKERATRLFEEVCELNQSLGVDEQVLVGVLLNVFERPVDSDYEGEVGDVAITFMSTVRSLGVSAMYAATKKAHRLREKMPEILERNKGKIKSVV